MLGFDGSSWHFWLNEIWHPLRGSGYQFWSGIGGDMGKLSALVVAVVWLSHRWKHHHIHVHHHYEEPNDEEHNDD